MDQVDLCDCCNEDLPLEKVRFNNGRKQWDRKLCEKCKKLYCTTCYHIDPKCVTRWQKFKRAIRYIIKGEGYGWRR